MNLNDRVKVRWTEHGLEAVEAYHRNVLGGMADHVPNWLSDSDADGWTSLQLWELVAILGPHMKLGFHGGPIIEEMSFEVEQEEVSS